MKKLVLVILLLGSVFVSWVASEEKPEASADKVHFKNLVTLRDFVILCMFPEWDQVVRVDVGNKNLFGAEASKDYPNFIVLFQKVPSSEVKRSLRTNATVLLKSGHVFHFLLSSLDHEKARPEKVPLLYNFTREYDQAVAAVRTVALGKPAPGISELEKTLLARLNQLEEKFDRAVAAKAEAQAREQVLDWIGGESGPGLKKASENGLEVVIEEIRKSDGLSLIGFRVLNRGAAAVEILEPQITLETLKGKRTLRAHTVPLERLRLTATKIEAKGATRGALAFRSDGARDANQVFKLAIARKDAADKPVQVTLF